MHNMRSCFNYFRSVQRAECANTKTVVKFDLHDKVLSAELCATSARSDYGFTFR